MEYLFFLGGMVVGSIVTQIIWRYKTGYGTFRLTSVDDPDEPELYNIQIGLKQGQPLLDKKRIVLRRNDSRK